MNTPKNKLSYKEQLASPKWQKRRLDILNDADWRCAICGETENQLHVHHLYYENGKEVWDYPNDALLALCIDCHENRLHIKGELFSDLPDLSFYYVVDYQHIDDFRCLSPLSRYFDPLFHYSGASQKFINILEKELNRRLSEFFTHNEWEGDGQISCIFIAPCFILDSDTHCETVFHVKQHNNGTSFLAIPKHLQLKLPDGFLIRRH